MEAMQYQSNTTLGEIVKVLVAGKRVLVTTHAKPDGDALGSVVALARALEMKGVEAECWVVPPVPEPLMVVSDHVKLWRVGDDGDGMPGGGGEVEQEGEFDCVVVLDTGAWSQLGGLREWLEGRREKMIVVDHHLHGDDIAEMMYVESCTGSTCEIVARLIDEMGCEYDGVIRDALFVGMAADTGWFRFSNTSDKTHELAARLLREGVDQARLYRKIEQGERAEKLGLMIRALDSLEIVNERVAIMTLTVDDFEQTGALVEETERFVDIPQIVESIEVVVLITDQRDVPVRLSFRSKAGEGAIDVSKVAREFGGGGHARAAGAKVDDVLANVRQRVVDVVEKLEFA